MSKEEFANRRSALREMLEPEAIVILPSSPEQPRNGDVLYPYRQDSDFYYLTGFPEPQAVAVMIPGRPQGEYLVFCRESDPAAETWNGKRAGLDGVCSEHGADDAFPITDIDDILPGLLENKKRIYYPMGRYKSFDQRLIHWVSQVGALGRSGIHAPDQFISSAQLVQEMRLFKSKFEIDLMRKAAEISASAHINAMKIAKPGIKEYELEAELISTFLTRGARSAAYPSIVGAGRNGCILHYIDNNSQINNGDLVLIDAGAEYEFYASDITRTFPINGRFTPEQKIVYEIVLEAQMAAIEAVRPGNCWNDPHEAAVKVITKGLVDMKILSGNLNKLIADESFRPYFMHRTGHWLGMDVHDVGEYKVDGEWRVLEEGMVTTVEPGLYFSNNIPGLDPKWWDIGIRIEDDVLVTEAGRDILSDRAPKEVSTIEELIL